MIDRGQTRLALSSVALAEEARETSGLWLIRIYPVAAISEPLPLPADTLLIGRDASCGLSLDDDSVSRRHAVIERTEVGYLLTDLSSRNGTYVNNERVTTRLLAPGDRLRFGQQILKVLGNDRLESQYFETVYKIMTTDGLTGTHNRRYLLDCLDREIPRAIRNARPLSVLLIDVDNFKKVNDTYGHLAGDEVLFELCQRMRGVLRTEDILGRFGGEEFAVILTEAAAADAWAGAERIRQAICVSPLTTDEATIPVTVSIGIATTDAKADEMLTAHSLLGRADERLYVAKRAGRNRVSA